MQEHNKFSLNNSDQTILLVGHGSSSQPMSGKILQAYGQYISSSENFRKVEVGAILGNPPLLDALQALKGSVRVLPVMMCNQHLVPDSINEFVEQNSEFSSAFQLSFLEPVGEAPEISNIAYSIAQDVVGNMNWDISKVTINLVAHGSTRRPASRVMTEHHAQNLMLMLKCRKVLVSYLEESPLFSDVVVDTCEPTISVGLFIGGGHHAVYDISKIINVDSPNKLHSFGGIVGDHFQFKELILNRASLSV